MKPSLAFALAALVFAAPAAAQSIRQNERYTLVVVDGGFIRLDTRSGEIARCTGDRDKLTCRLAADERLAYIGEIERMQERIDDLETRVADLEAGNAPPSVMQRDRYGLPSDDEIDQVMTMTDRVFRRFFGLVRELKRDLDQDRL